ncbi:MAG TPA: GPP34 family phosphoprotein [Streptosporangiaceae bacterium]
MSGGPHRRSTSRRKASPQLGGTGRLADDLYLMSHHEVSGKPHLHPRAIGLGLAGALLAELVLLGKLCIRPGVVIVADPTPPAEELASLVLGLVQNEREQHTAQVWLLYLARTATEDVAQRLAKSGYLARVSARRPWSSERWAPVDPDCAFTPLVRILPALDSSRPLTADGTALAGLAAACGLSPRMLLYAPPKATRRNLDEVVAQLGPDLRHLIAETQAAVDSALLSHRV